MKAKDIIKLVKKHHKEYAPAMQKEPDDNDIVMDMGKCIFCEDLLDKIDPNWQSHSPQDERLGWGERIELGADTCIENIDIRIPAFNISQLYYQLGCVPDKDNQLSQRDRVCRKIEEEGFVWRIENEDILINDCVLEDVQPLKDSLLLALKGVASPGSIITLYDDRNNQYKIVYQSPNRMSLYRGQIVFSEDEMSYIF